MVLPQQTFLQHQELKQKIGQACQRLRLQKGLSIEELSSQCHLPIPLLRNLEEGVDFTWPSVLSLAKFHNKKVDIQFLD